MKTGLYFLQMQKMKIHTKNEQLVRDLDKRLYEPSAGVTELLINL